MSHYLLVDPLRHDPVIQGESRRRHVLEQLAKAVPPKVYLMGNARGAELPEERVRLYAVNKGDELWQASQAWVASDKGRLSVCGWLESQHSLHTLGRHLDRLMIQHHPEQGRVHFRYFDQRTLHHLALILAPHQLASLLGPVRRWEYVDINGERQVLENQGMQTRFSMEADQWASVARLARINLCLRGWKHNVAPEPLPLDASLRVDHFVKMAESYGITEEVELIAFVLHGLATHERFDRHPLMAEVLRKRRHDGMSYVSLTDGFTEKEWMTISDDKTREGITG
ncbi:DUF4123 domain-containing protein [Halomonas sp. A29]|uniref:DUF4123 domain-containing protein n=1 Tax=Halomonas sp. A29 TaxID=3102786 RepID=UPI00398A5E12